MATADHKDDTADFRRNFHIVIVGAGLVGLASAILLRKSSYRVTVLEQDTELREARYIVFFCSFPQLLLTNSARLARASIYQPTPAEFWQRLVFSIRWQQNL